jgi:two-component system, cell cycle response regulator
VAASSPAPSAKVLVADDSDAERASARSALTEAGYTVVEATDGQQALEVFARERPDLVLLDVVMPRLTGLETCRILKAKTQTSYLPVIMVSTRNSVNARVEGLRSGADDYLGKPYDAEELRARVEALLRARRVIGDPEPGAQSQPRVAVPEPGAPTAVIDVDHTSFRRRMEEEFDRAERYSDPLACLRVELDGYLEMLRGDAEAARTIVSTLRDVISASIRKIDLVFRADDRGYMLVLPNTHFPGALSVAERIWRDAKRLTTSSGEACSVSIGVSFFPNRDTHSLHDLLQLVDAALERARSEGGGKICLYQHQGYLYAPED